MGFAERMLKLIGVWDPEESGFVRKCQWCDQYADRVIELTGPGGTVLNTAHCAEHTPQGNEAADQFLDEVGYGFRAQRRPEL